MPRCKFPEYFSRILASPRALSRAGLLTAYLAGLAGSVDAQHLGAEFQINTHTTGDQLENSVASDASGNFVVVWNSQVSLDDPVFGIFGQRFDAAGSPVGAEFQVNTYTTDAQYRPRVAADAAGNFLVVWTKRITGSITTSLVRAYSSDGSPQGPEVEVASGSAFNATVASNGAGSFVVAWQGSDGVGSGVRGRRFGSDGSPIGSDFLVNTYTTEGQGFPVVAGENGGDFIVVWSSYGQDGAGWGGFGQRFDVDGKPDGAEFQVNTATLGGQYPASVAIAESGEFFVSSVDFPPDGSMNHLVVRQFASTGQPKGPEKEVANSLQGLAVDPVVSAAAGGGYLVAWSRILNEFDGDVFARAFDAEGLPEGSQYRVNSLTAGFQTAPSVAAIGSGTYVATWEGPGDGHYSRVSAQRLQAPQFADSFEIGTVCEWSASEGSSDVCP